MGTLHYQVIHSGYHNNVQHWKYPPRMGKWEIDDWDFKRAIQRFKKKIEFYPSAIVFADDDYEYDDDYGWHPTVIKLDEQDEENQSYIVEGWYWRFQPDSETLDSIEYATDGYWELPYFSEE